MNIIYIHKSAITPEQKSSSPICPTKHHRQKQCAQTSLAQSFGKDGRASRTTGRRQVGKRLHRAEKSGVSKYIYKHKLLKWLLSQPDRGQITSMQMGLYAFHVTGFQEPFGSRGFIKNSIAQRDFYYYYFLLTVPCAICTRS